jgi:GNAT superfamily N-acetyltransferase
MKIETKELVPSMWPDLEELFGANGACGGCWCMSWRAQKGENWAAMKGKEAKKRFKKLVSTGAAHGIIAYHDQSPVGWCSFDKREDYFKLDRAPSLKCEDSDKVWSIPCFFIKKEYRGQGVGRLLLDHAVKALKQRGAKIAEGYPVKPYNYGKAIPAAFAWTGTIPLFTKSGFKKIGNKDGGKQRVRKLI